MNVGPAFFPRVLAAGLMTFSLLLIIQNLFLVSSEDGEKRFDIKDPGVHRAAVALAATIVYGIGMSFLGFIIMTVLYLLFMMYLMKMRKWIFMAGVSVAVSLTVYLVFSVMLNIALPEGFWA